MSFPPLEFNVALYRSLSEKLTSIADRHWSLASSELNSLTRMNFIANPALKGLLGMAGAELTETYAIHAVHLLGVADHEKLYIPYEQEHESIQLITGHEEACSAAFTRVGDGLFGYVGDFTFELGTRGVIKAMISTYLHHPVSSKPH